MQHIITTNWDEISGKQILLAMEKENSLEKELLAEEKEHNHNHEDECSCGHDHEQHHNHDEKCSCGHDHEQ